MAIRNTWKEAKPYITKDGSTIRELMHPQVHGNERMSLAEATVPLGKETFLHRHLRSAEIYHVIEGRGMMTLGEEKFLIEAGDTVYIPPGTPHKLRSEGEVPLRVLCFCSPPYSHEDTELL